MIDSFAASADAQALHINWSAGHETVLSAKFLRENARDAWTRREVIDFGAVRVDDGLHITKLIQIGSEGVNVHFSDGHDKAIYPFVYLDELRAEFDK